MPAVPLAGLALSLKPQRRGTPISKAESATYPMPKAKSCDRLQRVPAFKSYNQLNVPVHAPVGRPAHPCAGRSRH